jgi:hypothetical protein
MLMQQAGAQTDGAGAEPAMQLAQLQTAKNAPPREIFQEQLNANTVTVVSGNPNGTYLTFATICRRCWTTAITCASCLHRQGGGRTSIVLYLRAPYGHHPVDGLRYFQETGEVGPNIGDRIRYITRLHNEEMHVLARSDINSLQDLQGKTVNFSDSGSGTQTTSRLIFKDLKISVKEVNMGQADAFEALKRGEIAATVLIAGKPAGSFAKLKADPAYKLLPVPYVPVLQNAYLPATLTSQDYPGIISADQPVATVATRCSLFNGSRTPTVPPCRQVYRSAVQEDRKIPAEAPASQVERGQSRRHAARLAAFRRGSRAAGQGASRVRYRRGGQPEKGVRRVPRRAAG